MDTNIENPKYRPVTMDEINHAVGIYERVENFLKRPHTSFSNSSVDASVSRAFSSEPMVISDLVTFYQSKYFNYFLPLKNNTGKTTIASCKVLRGRKACDKFINKSGFLIYRASMIPSNNKTHQVYVVYYHPIKVGWLRSRTQFLLNECNLKKDTVYKLYGLEMDYTI